jgi:hypothetical protein
MNAHRRHVTTLRKAFADLKQDMDVRRFLLTHANRDGRFCDCCSRRRSPGFCGPTCALMRDVRESGTMFRTPEPWRREARATLCEYKAIATDMDRFGYNMSKPELEHWEDWADAMRYGGMSNVEKMDGEEPAFVIKVKIGIVNWTQQHPGLGLESKVSLKDAGKPKPEQMDDWVHVEAPVVEVV